MSDVRDPSSFMAGKANNLLLFGYEIAMNLNITMNDAAARIYVKKPKATSATESDLKSLNP